MAGRIGVVGSVMTDLITYGDRLPKPGETLEAARFVVGRGGKGANQAVAAARLGAKVAMIGRVGADQFGEDTRRSLIDDGIDISHLQISAGVSTGVAPIFVTASGENSILIVKGANALLTPADVAAAADLLLGCDLILLQLEIPLETVYAVIDWAHGHGRRVLLNPAPATEALAFDRIAPVDYFVPNQTELAILSDLPTGSVAEAEAAARHLLRHGMRQIIVTLGREGVLLVTVDSVLHIPAVSVEAVDTTGAGDAFIGAFAFHETAGETAETALRMAAAYAALSVTRPGTQASFASAAEFGLFGSVSSRATRRGLW
jgi:ribokinase